MKLQYFVSPPPQDTIEGEVSNIIDLRPSNIVDELIFALASMREAMVKNFDEMEVDLIQPSWCCNETPLLFRVFKTNFPIN